MALKLYFQNAAAPYTPATKRGDWDDDSASLVKALGTSKSGAWTSQDTNYYGAADPDETKLAGIFTYVLPHDFKFQGAEIPALSWFVFGLFRRWWWYSEPWPQPRVHAYVLDGDTGELKGTLKANWGQSFVCKEDGGCKHYWYTDSFMGKAGDVIVLEMGFYGEWNGQGTYTAWLSYGGTGSDLTEWNTTGVPWIEFGGIVVVAPNAPTLTSPVGTEVWREGETRQVTWTPADPEQADGLECVYDIQFSAAGDFTDAVDIATGADGGSYSWKLAESLVTADTSTCKLRIRARVDFTDDSVSDWVTSGAFTVKNSTAPTVSLVVPLDAELLQGLLPTFVFGTADIESDPVHAELQISGFADFRSLHIDTDSAEDYVDWETAADPFETWVALPAGGATAGNRVRYAVQDPFRYDNYYGRVRVKDTYSTSEWTYFTFVISGDPGAALAVSVEGHSYRVEECVITEETGGEASVIQFKIALKAYRAYPVAAGDAVAVTSAFGGHNRSWNATIETISFVDTAVSITALQDDAYLSRKLVTGDKTSADLGANLAAYVDEYGAPLTGTAIDTSTGVSMPLEGGHKYLREHLDDGSAALPTYLYWVDSGGDVHLQDGADMPDPDTIILEADPAAYGA